MVRRYQYPIGTHSQILEIARREKRQLECERFPALGGESRETKVYNFYCNCFSERRAYSSCLQTIMYENTGYIALKRTA